MWRELCRAREMVVNVVRVGDSYIYHVAVGLP